MIFKIEDLHRYLQYYFGTNKIACIPFCSILQLFFNNVGIYKNAYFDSRTILIIIQYPVL